jgi:hypothetical protein
MAARGLRCNLEGRARQSRRWGWSAQFRDTRDVQHRIRQVTEIIVSGHDALYAMYSISFWTLAI